MFCKERMALISIEILSNPAKNLPPPSYPAAAVIFAVGKKPSWERKDVACEDVEARSWKLMVRGKVEMQHSGALPL